MSCTVSTKTNSDMLRRTLTCSDVLRHVLRCFPMFSDVFQQCHVPFHQLRHAPMNSDVFRCFPTFLIVCYIIASYCFFLIVLIPTPTSYCLALSLVVYLLGYLFRFSSDLTPDHEYPFYCFVIVLHYSAMSDVFCI
jgi:hypothetical protein